MKRLGLVVSILVVALIASLLVRVAIVDDRDPLKVVHWSNSHPLREGLLVDMAARFNDADHETASGQSIEIVIVSCDSAVQADDLVARVTGGGGAHGCEDKDGNPADNPTIVTPQSDDWLVDINDRTEPDVIDPATTQAIAETYLGIVTYREMAECLESSGEPVGYFDIVELATDAAGWDSLDCPTSVSWGSEPLLAFTNPNTSTSGRNVLVTLYTMAAGGADGIKAPADLTVEDIERPEVVDWVTRFQEGVDHYLQGTIQLNRKIEQGEDAGHFFLMPEDNLVGLYKGNEFVRAPDGTKQELDPVKGLVMIYPEEGSVLNSNPAAVVDASWVSGEEANAAQDWIDHLRDDEQQRAFMSAGFRPAAGTGLDVDAAKFEEWGLEAEPPATVIDPGELHPDVLNKIIGSWGAVKKPSIVTFVVDVSGSMEGEALEQVQAGLVRVFDQMGRAGADTSQIGLVTFDSEINEPIIAPAPFRDVGGAIGDAINEMEASGSTSLYDAVEKAIALTDAAEGAPGTTRAVVILSDGGATSGTRCLDHIVDMVTDGADIDRFCRKFERDGTTPIDSPVDENGEEVPVEEVTGEKLHMPLQNDDLQIFFLGFSEADLNVGRILADATDADFQGSTEEDLATVIEALSGYF